MFILSQKGVVHISGWARVVDDAFERACLWKIITEGKIVVEICLRL